MFCPNCGVPVSDGANFCEKCGAPVAIAEENTTAWGAEMNANTFYAQPAAPVATKSSGKGVAGFVLALVGMFTGGLILGILGIIFSVMGLKEIGRDPSLTGRGMALAGLIISIVQLAFWAFILFILFVAVLVTV